MRKKYVAAAVATVAFVLGGVTVPAPAVAAPQARRHAQPHADSRLAVWTSSHNMAEWTPQLWQVLTHNHIALFVQVNAGDYGPDPSNPWATEIIREADRRGLPVTVWIGGNDRTTAASEAELTQVHGWLKADRLHAQGVVIDDEATAQTMALIEEAMAGDQAAEQQVLTANLDPAQQCQAITADQSMIERAHRDGLRLDVTPIPESLDDLDAGTLALQDTMDATSNPPTDWDATYFQAYLSDYTHDFGPGVSSGLLTSYYESAHKYLGSAGDLTIGVAGLAPYATLAPLVHDVRLLATLGQQVIPVFSLETIISGYGVDSLNSLAAAAHQPLPTIDRPTAADRQARATYQGLAREVAALTPQITEARDGVAQQANTYPLGDGCAD